MRDLQTKASFVHGECTASRDTASSFFKRRLIAGTGGLAVMRTSGLQLGLAPPKQLGNRIDAIGDVPSVAQIELCLVQPADVTRPHLRLQTLPGLRQDALLRATSLRGRQQRRQAAFAIALPPTLSRSHTIAQHLRRLADARDTLFLEKPKQPQAIGSGLVTSRFLRSLQPGDIFLDQQRVSDVHTQPPVQSRPPILNRANKPALLLIPILPIFSLCRTSRFIRIGMTPSNLASPFHASPLLWTSWRFAGSSGATHEGFWSHLQEPDINLATIQGLVFQEATLSPAS